MLLKSNLSVYLVFALMISGKSTFLREISSVGLKLNLKAKNLVLDMDIP